MDAYLDTSRSFEERALDLVSRMTLEEKISQLSFDAPEIPRLGIRAWTWWNEASHGVIPVFQSFAEASSFPVCLALANSWDPALVKETASAISDEMRALYNLNGKELDYWCPTVNMGRDPRWGRNDEAFGEDPLLAGTLAASYVQGIQGEDARYLKAVSTPKHFAANNSEYNRNSASSNMDEATLREYFLPVFERCFREGKAQSVMTAYNRISGVPCSVNEHLLQDILRDEWGFDGYVVSDDGAVGDIGPNYNLMWGQPRGHFYASTMQEGSALALNAGTDICCGNDYKVWLKTALEEGFTTEEALDRALVHAFTARFRLGEFDPAEKLPWHGFRAETLCSEAHAATALRAAEASMTLLRNENDFLPLRKEKAKKLLVIGPNAIYRQLGSYSIGGYADTRVSVPPLAGIREIGESLGFTVSYAKGWHILDKPIEGGNRFPVLERAAEENGLGMDEYFDARTPEPVKELNRQLAARRAQRAQLPPPVPRHPVDDPDLDKSGEDLWEEALHAAKEADAVIVVAGTDPSVTSEGRDRATLALPYDQDAKIRQLKAINPNIAVVLITSGPVTGQFLSEVPAVLWAVYAGESQGTAIAKVLFGQISPSGRSCETWYNSDDELPHISDYGIRPLDTPNQMGRTYQYWLGKPLFPFGHGLSYASFEYSNCKWSGTAFSPNDTLELSVTVRNCGGIEGEEVVQLYGKKMGLWLNQAYRKLLAFEKIRLMPGEEKRVTLSVPLSDMKVWHTPSKKYVVPEGDWYLWLGRSAGSDAEIAGEKIRVTGKWDAPLSAVTLRCDKRILLPGEKAELSLTATLMDAGRIGTESASLESTDENVLKVENGEVTALRPGLCLVKMSLERCGVTKTCRLPFLVRE